MDVSPHLSRSSSSPKDHAAHHRLYSRRFKMAAIEAELNDWHQRLYMVHIDLVGDYAGQELFFIEGDSLLRLAFSDDRIDMDSTLYQLA